MSTDTAPTTTPATPAAPAAAKAAEPPAKAPSSKAEAPAKPEAEAKSAEPSKVEEPARKPEPDAWAKLSAAEKRIAKQRAEVEEQRRKLDEERKSHSDRLGLIERAKSGDWEAREKLLAETGLSYDDWTKRQLRGGKADPVELARRAAIEEVERREAARAERERAEREAAANEQWKATHEAFASHVRTGKPPEGAGVESFALLHDALEHNGPEVEGWLKRMAQAHPHLTIAEASISLEKALRADHDRRAARLRPATPTPETPPAEAPKTSEQQQRPRDQGGRFAREDGPPALTNRLSAERSASPSSSREQGRKLTPYERDQAERERLRRAAAALRR